MNINWGRLTIGALVVAVICFVTDGFTSIISTFAGAALYKDPKRLPATAT